MTKKILAVIMSVVLCTACAVPAMASGIGDILGDIGGGSLDISGLLGGSSDSSASDESTSGGSLDIESILASDIAQEILATEGITDITDIVIDVVANAGSIDIQAMGQERATEFIQGIINLVGAELQDTSTNIDAFATNPLDIVDRLFDTDVSDTVGDAVNPPANDEDDLVITIGDVNSDGVITPADARITLRKAANLVNLTDEQAWRADMTGDGVITPEDARIILRIAANLDSVDNYHRVLCTNHSFTSEVVTESTCTQFGSEAYTCSVCGYVQTEAIALADHVYADSFGNGDVCIVCGHINEEDDDDVMVPDESDEIAAVLGMYTEIMNNLKNNVDTYEKKEFQTLGNDYNLGSVGNLILPIAAGMITGEDEAEIQQRNDAEQIPLVRNDLGCILTDTSAVKSATATEADGKITITIVLNDEEGSTPAPAGATEWESAVGSMFNPLAQADVDDIASSFSSVFAINDFTVTYKNCTAVLVYDAVTGEVEMLEQTMDLFIEFEGSVGFIVPIDGYATLTNNMIINNVTYR